MTDKFIYRKKFIVLFYLFFYWNLRLFENYLFIILTFVVVILSIMSNSFQVFFNMFIRKFVIEKWCLAQKFFFLSKLFRHKLSFLEKSVITVRRIEKISIDLSLNRKKDKKQFIYIELPKQNFYFFVCFFTKRLIFTKSIFRNC